MLGRFCDSTLTNLGSADTPSVADTKSLQLFIIQQYCRHNLPNINDLASLRCYLLSKQQLDSQKISPTRQPAKYFNKKFFKHITLLFSGNYGWKWDSTNSLYETATTTLPPALETTIHLTICNCKTNCVSLRCKCCKSGFSCSELRPCDDRVMTIRKMIKTNLLKLQIKILIRIMST